MKKIILAAVAASVVAAPAAAAPFGYNDRDNRGRVVQVQKKKVVERNNGRKVVTRKVVRDNHVKQRNWRKGERFDRSYARNYRVIENPRAYRLHDAPRGYRWVQSDNNAVLVAIASGLIGAVIGNAL